MIRKLPWSEFLKAGRLVDFWIEEGRPSFCSTHNARRTKNPVNEFIISIFTRYPDGLERIEAAFEVVMLVENELKEQFHAVISGQDLVAPCFDLV